ncbi:L,D-transpeptidase family protein [Clostridium taeniosporum]|uniref:Peptidoglycan-binding protein n=1 Tax=Clostridium taeniosporum TaxID=394958 RepID=A0A1D7XJE1_9CLOT|nr:L,D-transpeptidase family protein [Clostridium taeniosporum]AOR23436.1 peptidoglycan-binding protein [Clostridium taeniosporum]
MNKLYKVKYLKYIGIIFIIMYFILSFYFINHFYFGTVINGVNISCKNIDEANAKISNEIESYKLELEERDGIKEEILSTNIGLKYDSKEKLQQLKNEQKPFKWILQLFKSSNYKNINLTSYDENLLKKYLENLSCFDENKVVQPSNPSFKYLDNKYIILEETYGNKVKKDVLYNNVVKSINNGAHILNLEESDCYENPKYTSDSPKVIEVNDKLNKYILSKITYDFGDRRELLDGSIINQWLLVDNDLNIIFDEKKIRHYVNEIANVYNTVARTREFSTSMGTKVKVTGGNYGWLINVEEEIKALINIVESGENITREPIYRQKASSREINDIGKTYVEINFTKQHLWFYKEGSIITQGDIVTGNVNLGHDTPIGVYILNYKQKDATLKGDTYETKVKYWMPFNGGIGIHDAVWRNQFGGNIYKSNGSHGCVNAPSYLAQKIFENIEQGTPIVCYYE